MPVIKYLTKHISIDWNSNAEENLYTHLKMEAQSDVQNYRKTYIEDILYLSREYGSKIDGFITMLATFSATDSKGKFIKKDSPVLIPFNTDAAGSTINLMKEPNQDYLIAQCPIWNRTIPMSPILDNESLNDEIIANWGTVIGSAFTDHNTDGSTNLE